MLKSLKIKHLIADARKRPGHISAFGIMGGLWCFTYGYGPHIESNLYKYVLAGTTATVYVELASHYIDTINMRSKVIS